MSGSDGPSVPEPTPEEKALQEEQAQLLQIQREQLEERASLRDALIPTVSKELGFEPVRDESGEITGFEPTELGQQRQELQSQLLERQQQALAGELPVSPALERDIRERETALRQRLRSKLGPGFETSTPGLEAVGEFEESALIARDAARRGDLQTVSQIRRGIQPGQRVGDLFTATQAGGQGFGTLASRFGQAQQPFHEQRTAEFNAALARQRQQSNRAKGFATAGGSIGAAVGGPFGAAAGAGAGLLLSQVF